MIPRVTTTLIPAVALFLSGCAYYNTFFHAQEYYEQAEKQREKLPLEQRARAGLDLYEKSMKKCAKVIVEYPDSKWVDDAVLLMGKCMYAKGEHLNAIRKFEEIDRYYPDTEGAREANFFKAKSYVALEQYADGVGILEQFLDDSDDERRREAAYLMASVEYERGEYATAAIAFEKYLESEEGGAFQSDILRLLGNSYRESGDLENAYGAFERRLRDPQLRPEDRLEAQLEMVQILVDQERFEEAHHRYEEIRMDVTFREDSLRVDLGVGRLLAAEGSADDAVKLLEGALENPPSTPVAGEMAHELGMIYLNTYGLKDSAASAFAKVARHPADPEIKDEAAKLATSLTDYLTLQRSYEGDEGDGAGLDSARTEFLLAEHELFVFHEPETAYSRYDFVARRYPGSSFAPLALAAKATLIKERGEPDSVDVDSLVTELVRIYPRSPQAGELLDRGEVSIPEDSLEAWRASWDEKVALDSVAGQSGELETRGRRRVFLGEGEVDIPDSLEIFPGPPAPLRLEYQADADYPRIEGRPPGIGEVEVEVEVDGLGRVRDAWVLRSSDPRFEGPALAAAYLCRYKDDGAEGSRRTSLTFRFRPE